MVSIYAPYFIIKRAFKSAGGDLTDDSFWTALEAWDDIDYYRSAWYMNIEVDSRMYLWNFRKSVENVYAQAFVNF